MNRPEVKGFAAVAVDFVDSRRRWRRLCHLYGSVSIPAMFPAHCVLIQLQVFVGTAFPGPVLPHSSVN